MRIHLRGMEGRARGETVMLAALGKRTHTKHRVLRPDEKLYLLMGSSILEAVF